MSPVDYGEVTSRNAGIISAQNQEILRNSLITIAGCGGAGGSTAVSLARLGARNFRLADPDYMDYSNINRQEGAFISTVGKNKTEAIRDLIHDIDPSANVECHTNGIDEHNIEAFLSGSDVILEEVDYRKPQYTKLVHQTARKLGIHILTGIPVAWNAFLFYFHPEGMTYEEYVGLHESEPKEGENIRSTDINVAAFVPEPPLYMDITTIKAILAEEIDIPALDPGVRLASALTCAYTYFFLTKSKELLPIPHYYSTGDIFQSQPKQLSDEEKQFIQQSLGFNE